MTTKNPLVQLLTEDESLKRGRELGVDDYISKMNIFRALLNHPKLAKELNSTIMTLVNSEKEYNGEKLISDRQREIIIMRTAWLVKSEYEWSQHWWASLFFGLTESDLSHIRDWQMTTCFSDIELVLLAATDAVITNGKMTSVLVADIKKYFPSDKALIEIVTCISNWHMFGMLLNALEIPLEAGMTRWPPDGKGPTSP